MKQYDFLVVGAGIFGITAAVELQKRGYQVGVLNPDSIPHPMAASTDISKVIRMEYGADLEYMAMADAAIDGWHGWNDFFQDKLYHETGFLMLCKQNASNDPESFEGASSSNLIRRGHQPERLSKKDLELRFPAFASGPYTDAIFNSRAGFAESGRVVQRLAAYAVQLGVEIWQYQSVLLFEKNKGRVVAVQTREGQRFAAGEILLCAGAYTPNLLPELKPILRATGHPVFHLRPSRPELFQFPQFSVFTSDISHTGWYGFPLHPTENVVKIANHGIGIELDPERDERVVTAGDIANLRAFLEEHIPTLANDPVVFTRRCLYSDTRDGHFWIDRHPELKNLVVAAGGSGHGFKMAPVLGAMITDVATGGKHKWSDRYRWRQFDANTRQLEEARFKAE